MAQSTMAPDSPHAEPRPEPAHSSTASRVAPPGPASQPPRPAPANRPPAETNSALPFPRPQTVSPRVLLGLAGLSALLFFCTALWVYQGIDYHIRFYYLNITYVPILSCIAFILFCAHIFDRPGLRSPWRIGMTLLLFALIPRLFWVFLGDTQQVSDFLAYHTAATQLSAGTFVPDYAFSMFPFKLMYSWVLSRFYRVFGAQVVVAQVINLAAAVALLLEVYLLARRVWSEATARMAGLLFSIWPSQLFYSSVVATEHLFASLLLGSCVAVCALTPTASFRRQLGMAALAGGLAGLANSLRPVALMMLPCVVGHLCFFAFPAHRPLALWRRKAGLAAIIGATAALSFMAITLPASQQTGVPCWRASMGFSLLSGTNPQSRGHWSDVDAAQVAHLASAGFDAYHGKSLSIATARIRENPAGMLGLMASKLQEFWRDDSFGVEWGVSNLQATTPIAKIIKQKLWTLFSLSHVFYCSLLIFSGVTCVFYWQTLYPAGLLLLLLLAHAVSFSLLEIQSRYHYFADLLMFVLASRSLTALLDGIRQRWPTPARLR